MLRTLLLGTALIAALAGCSSSSAPAVKPADKMEGDKMKDKMADDKMKMGDDKMKMGDEKMKMADDKMKDNKMGEKKN